MTLAHPHDPENRCVVGLFPWQSVIQNPTLPWITLHRGIINNKRKKYFIYWITQTRFNFEHFQTSTEQSTKSTNKHWKEYSVDSFISILSVRKGNWGTLKKDCEYRYVRWQPRVQSKTTPNHTETLVRNISCPSKMYVSYFPSNTVSSPVLFAQNPLLEFQSGLTSARCGHPVGPMWWLLSSGDLNQGMNKTEVRHFCFVDTV